MYKLCVLWYNIYVRLKENQIQFMEVKNMANKILSEVYNSLSDVVFKHNPTKEEMEQAIEWFLVHFYDEGSGDEE